jgi:hypothetical protein
LTVSWQWPDERVQVLEGDETEPAPDASDHNTLPVGDDPATVAVHEVVTPTVRVAEPQVTLVVVGGVTVAIGVPCIAETGMSAQTSGGTIGRTVASTQADPS